MKGMNKLSNKQRVFMAEYLQCWNATEAARRAGYAHPNKQGPRLLVNVGISEEIEQKVKEKQMGADEALSLLADIARGDMADLMDVTSVGWVLDMKKAQERGKTKLIKKVKQTTITKIGRKQDDDDEERTYLEVELYPADVAIRDILKVHGKFTEKLDITSKGEQIESISDERFDRTISTLIDAIGESLSRKSDEPEGAMGSAE